MPNNKDFMNIALSLARGAAIAGDVPVGCVVVRGGEVIGAGRNRREADNDALAHAEMIAIKAACEKTNSWRLDDCVLYVTLEPCVMCAGAIVSARIKRVVFGAYDAKGGAFGGLTDLNLLGLNHRPEVIGGVSEDECADILRAFFAVKRDT